MMVDMHCHVVWGIDDGARTEEDTRAMLRLAAENRVGDLVCTSHITPGEAPFPRERYDDHLARAQAFCDSEGLGLTLHPGSEILYTDQTPRLVREGKVPLLNGKHAVLVEFWYDAPYRTMCEAARLLGNEGMLVIFAHIERYKETRSVRHVEELRGEYGVYTQVNARTIAEKQGFMTDRWKRKLLDADLIDLVSSDAHNVTSRPCNVLKAWEALSATHGSETADRLCGGCAREILSL